MILSIAILTYNRARCLENLLNEVLPQAKELEGQVEVCVSNNCSKDNTREVVLGFQKRYPGLIKYNENESNLGSDRNILKVMEMASGDFIWTLGDDDSLSKNAVREVVGFIKKIDKEKTGLITVAFESYFVDQKTNMRVVCVSTVKKDKPEVFKMDKKDVIGIPFPNAGFISLLIYNNYFFKKIMQEDQQAVEGAVGCFYVHVFLRSLMFLKYPELDALLINKALVFQELPSYKFFVEDKFTIQYWAQKRLNKLLIDSRYSDDWKARLIKRNNKLKWGFLQNLLEMRAFKNFNYLSYLGCIKLFFQKTSFADALLFSMFFSVLFLISSVVLIFLYKTLFMVKHGRNWKARWNLATNFIFITNNGSRRQTE